MESEEEEEARGLAAIERRRRMRLLVVGLFAAGVISTMLWTRGGEDRGVLDCGDLSMRPTTPGAPPLPHDRHCRLVGTVQSDVVLSMGKETPGVQDPIARKVGLRYFVKLDGAPVVAVLAGGDPQVEAWRVPRDSLLGYRIEGVGRIFDPTREKGYDLLGATLLAHFHLPADGSLRVFDTADRP